MNAFVHVSPLVPGYGRIKNILDTDTGTPQTLDKLTHIECYMNEMITEVQDRPKLKRPVFGGTV